MVVRQTIFDPASWVALKHTLRHGAYVSGRSGCRPRVAISASEKFSVAGTSPNGTSCCASTLITVVAMNTTSDPAAIVCADNFHGRTLGIIASTVNRLQLLLS